MKRGLMLIALTVSVMCAALGQYDFRAKCPEGQVMYFKIMADSATVRVTHPGPNWPYYDPEHRLHGTVTVPPTVEWQGRTYRVTEVSECAFYRNDSLTGIRLPQVRRIGSQAFCGCTALAEIEVPEGTEEISDGVFANCRSLRRMVLPGSVRRLGTSAFALCDGLQMVRLPQGLYERTDASTFAGCTAIDEGKIAEKREDGSVILASEASRAENLCH